MKWKTCMNFTSVHLNPIWMYKKERIIKEASGEGIEKEWALGLNICKNFLEKIS